MNIFLEQVEAENAMTCDFCVKPSGVVVGAGTRRPVQPVNGWYLLPSLGPLADMHVLLIPVQHRLASLVTAEDVNTLRTITDVWKQVVSPRSSLFFEHANSITGCGITHAHVHLLGSEHKVGPEIFGSAMVASETTLETIAQENRELFWCSQGEQPFSMTGTFRSQFGRERVAAALGRPQYDWRQGSDPEWLESSQAAATALARLLV